MLLVEDMILMNKKKLSFELKEGEDRIIRGRNGLGKSLFLKSLADLLPFTYERFLFQTKKLTEWNPQEYRSQVLYVHSTIPAETMKVEEYLNLPLQLEIYQGHQAPDLTSYLERWHISKQEIHHLSQGQRQLLTLLRATSLKAKLLLLDEPFSHLDQQRTQEARSLLISWKKRSGGSLIIVTHDEADARELRISETDLEELFKN